MSIIQSNITRPQSAGGEVAVRPEPPSSADYPPAPWGFVVPTLDGISKGPSMAGDWIKWVKGLIDKPEVIQMASRLGLPRSDVAGRLMRLWEWADDNCNADGNAPGVTESFIDETAMYAGFCEAMVQIGWMMSNGEGLTFPNFERHNAQPAKARALTRKRVARHRNADSVTNVTPPSLPEKRREEKRREEESIEEKRPPNPLRGKQAKPAKVDPLKLLADNLPAGTCLNTETFRAAWLDWIEYRRSTGKKATMTQRAVQLQLAKLEKWGVDGAVQAIEQSISNGWAGLFEPKGNDDGLHGRRPTADSGRPAGKARLDAQEHAEHLKLVDTVRPRDSGAGGPAKGEAGGP